MSPVITDRRGQRMLLTAVALGMFMDGLDGSIVTVALPTISESLGGDAGSVSWVMTIYFMVMAALILIFGKISDSGAIKKVFTIGFLLFSLSSLACGLSTGLELLLVSRAAQGAGAAMLAASALLLCVKYYPSERLGFGLSIAMLGMTVGMAIGPAVGGFLVQFVSWQWIFYINVPIGLLAILFALKAIPADEGLAKTSFDVRGSVLLFMMLASGLYLVESLPSSGVTGLTVPAALGSIISLALFVVHERRCASPVLNLKLFRSKALIAVLASYLILNACYVGTMYLLPFYLDMGMGFDPVTIGLYLLIPSVVILLTCTGIGKLSDRTGRRTFVIISCMMMVAFMAILSMINPEMGVILLIAALVIIGLVWGIGGGTASSRIVEIVPPSERGSASSLMSFILYFGCALGAAMFAALFGAGAGVKGVDISEMPWTHFLDGFHFAMMAGVALSVVALVLAAVVNEKWRNKNAGEPTPAASREA